MAGLKKHSLTVVACLFVFALAGGAVAVLGGHGGKAPAKKAAPAHAQKAARRGHVVAAKPVPVAKPKAAKREVVPVDAPERRSLVTVRADSFFNAAREIVVARFGSQSLAGAHVSLSISCADGTRWSPGAATSPRSSSG